eukprot:CAMPEP_0184129530 /NCGR_PEP_ID=MMETSP0974-20121125/27138_1 /TAXON_ID=483370 /ORGANISM="non described non described, Strain CCMP2097" /LENGTH=41 /DNA_ID= /DNA_START= /DNA_END= /DNA_ORIENTATION=
MAGWCSGGGPQTPCADGPEARARRGRHAEPQRPDAAASGGR